VEHFLDHPLVSDLITEGPQLICGDVEAEIFHTFAGLELDLGELLSQPIHVNHLHMIYANANLMD
jgi:hypothetical protein